MDIPADGASGRQARRARAAARRLHRHEAGAAVAATQGGVASRALLRRAGLSKDDVRAEIEAGRWQHAGWHTVAITATVPQGAGLWWRAIWESGARAVLDGTSALLAAGLQHWAEDVVDVSVPNGARPRATPGVRHHQVRDLGPLVRAGPPRTHPEVAVLRAAQWARSERAAATVLAMTVQQGLVRPERLLQRWQAVRASPRGPFLATVIRDVCAGAESLNELDFARRCRERGLPTPTRQQVRRTPTGTSYLDVWFAQARVHVEIHGAQHGWGLAVVTDALKANEVTLADGITIQIPVLGLRVSPRPFMDQVERAVRAGLAARAG